MWCFRSFEIRKSDESNLKIKRKMINRKMTKRLPCGTVSTLLYYYFPREYCITSAYVRFPLASLSFSTRRALETHQLGELKAIYRKRGFVLEMESTVDAVGEPIPTSAVLMSSSKHIGMRCFPENMAFLKCKKKDPNPEKCLDKGQEVTRCVLSLLKDLHQRCTKEMDAYAGCMYYNTNEFDLCRKEQQEFEKACPLE